MLSKCEKVVKEGICLAATTSGTFAYDNFCQTGRLLPSNFRICTDSCERLVGRVSTCIGKDIDFPCDIDNQNVYEDCLSEDGYRDVGYPCHVCEVFDKDKCDLSPFLVGPGSCNTLKAEVLDFVAKLGVSVPVLDQCRAEANEVICELSSKLSEYSSKYLANECTIEAGFRPTKYNETELVACRSVCKSIQHKLRKCSDTHVELSCDDDFLWRDSGCMGLDGVVHYRAPGGSSDGDGFHVNGEALFISLVCIGSVIVIGLLLYLSNKVTITIKPQPVRAPLLGPDKFSAKGEKIADSATSTTTEDEGKVSEQA